MPVKIPVDIGQDKKRDDEAAAAQESNPIAGDALEGLSTISTPQSA
jgi:hypothetical protein